MRRVEQKVSRTFRRVPFCFVFLILDRKLIFLTVKLLIFFIFKIIPWSLLGADTERLTSHAWLTSHRLQTPGIQVNYHLGSAAK